MQNEKDKPWFVLTIKAKQEIIVEHNLKKMGAEVYMPRYYKTVKKDKEKSQVIVPLFSGYLFARFDIVEHYHKVMYTRGVKSVLGNSTSIWFLENNIIKEIKRREQGGVITLKKRNENFTKGDVVVVDEGRFDGWEGIFQENLPEKDRVLILLTMGFTGKMTVARNTLIKKK